MSDTLTEHTALLAEARRRKDTLLVAEMFGPTLQGEGPSTGMPANFLRLSSCNLHCAWCDTPYTWDWTRFSQSEESCLATVQSLISGLRGRPAPLLVITGGEPMMQAPAVSRLIAEIRESPLRETRIEVETNGTLPMEGFFMPDQYNVSVKLRGNEADSERVRIRRGPLLQYRNSGRAVWKFVITDRHFHEDLDEVEHLADNLDLPDDRIWLMPEGTTPGRILTGAQRLAPECIKRGWHLSYRLHIVLWGNQRGR